MTPAARMRLRWLGIALILVLAIWFVRSRGDRPADGAVQPSNAVARQGGANAGGKLPVADVKLELLEAGQAGMDTPDRNPFQFQPKPQPPPPEPIGQPRADRAAPAAPTGPPPPPPIALRLIGLVDAEQPANRIGIFSDPRGQGQNTPIYGKEGDIIEGRYRILRVGTDSAELAYLDGRGRQTLRMSGQ